MIVAYGLTARLDMDSHSTLFQVPACSSIQV